jgi:membrane protease YdiL (CAAX protease family)
LYIPTFYRTLDATFEEKRTSVPAVHGAASIAVSGLLFGLMFLLTGNLLLSVVFHSAMDLRMLLLLRPPVLQAT